jgi:hypothetical protein
MPKSAVKMEIINQIEQLDYDNQKRVLDFARVLNMTGSRGVPGKQLLVFGGHIPSDELKTMALAIEENCESEYREALYGGSIQRN